MGKEKFADYDELDRIEHIHGFSHCRCLNKQDSKGNFSCRFYKKSTSIKFRKRDLPAQQQCYYCTDSGYCNLSRLDELKLIKSMKIENLHLIADRITTQQGLNLLKQLGIDV